MMDSSNVPVTGKRKNRDQRSLLRMCSASFASYLSGSVFENGKRYDK
jgi:hypothetical protein